MKEWKRQPTHPGKIIREDYLMPLSIIIKDMASTGFYYQQFFIRKVTQKLLNHWLGFKYAIQIALEE